MYTNGKCLAITETQFDSLYKKTPISRNALSDRFIGNFFERLCRLQGKSFCPVTVC